MSEQVRGIQLNFDYGTKIWRIGTREDLLQLEKTKRALRLCVERLPKFQYRLVTTGDLRAEKQLQFEGESRSKLRPDRWIEAEQSLLYTALDEGRIDCFLEDLTTLPYRLPKDYDLACFLPRGDVRDVLVLPKKKRFEELTAGDKVLCGTERMAFQLRSLRPELSVEVEASPIQAQLMGLQQGDYEAVVAVADDLLHSDLTAFTTALSFHPFSPLAFCPAPGQGQMVLVHHKKNLAERRQLKRDFEKRHDRQAYETERRLATCLTGRYLDVNRLAAVHVYGEEPPRVVAVNTQSQWHQVLRYEGPLAREGHRRVEPAYEQQALHQLLGAVAFVGAGPGQADLLTVRARDLIANAEAVVYDNPIVALLLSQCDCSAEQIDLSEERRRQKIAGESYAMSPQLLRLLIQKARKGKSVVRLCLGDPWFFSPAIEEARALKQVGIRYEVVPGVTAAGAASIFSGFPFSLEGQSESIHWINASALQAVSSVSQRTERYRRLLEMGGTLVFLMPITTLPELTAGLQKVGLSGETPCLLIQNPSLPIQRQLFCPLTDLAERAVKEDFRPPAVLVMGEALSVGAEGLSFWQTLGALRGKLILLAKSRALDPTTLQLKRQLESEGAQILELDLVRHYQSERNRRWMDQAFREVFEPGHEAFKQFERGEVTLVFTSGTAVEAFQELLQRHRFDLRRLIRVKVAAYGHQTLLCLAKMGLQADYVPEVEDLEHLAEGLVKRLRRRERVIHIRGSMGQADLGVLLRLNDVHYTEWIAYESVRQKASEKTLEVLLPQASAILLASPAAAHSYYEILQERALYPPQSLRVLPLLHSAQSAMKKQTDLAPSVVALLDQLNCNPDQLLRYLHDTLSN